MRLKRIEMDGIRDGGALRIDLAPAATVCVTGDAGSGKTTALEAIAAARAAFLPGALELDADAWRGKGRAGAFVELEWELDELERVIAPRNDGTFVARWQPGGESTDVPARMRERVASTRFHYFDASRLVAPASPFAAERAASRPERTTDWMPSARKYDWVERYLLARGDAGREETAARVEAQGVALASRDRSLFARAMERMCPAARLGRPVLREGARLAGFVRPDGTERSLAELTTGERMAVLFAATIEAAELEGALVLIDTPELGIHPSQHASFLAGITECVGSGSVIAATTSAAILRAAPRETVKVLNR